MCKSIKQVIVLMAFVLPLFGFCQTPIVDFNFDVNTQCLGSSTVFHNTSTGTFTGFIKWQWDFGDGTILDQLTLTDAIHSFANAGVYKVRLSAYTYFGDPQKVIFIEIFSSGTCSNTCPSAGFTVEYGVCSQYPTSLVNTSRIPTNISSGVTYQWDFGDPASGVLNHPAPTSNLDPVVHTFVGNEPFNVTLTAIGPAPDCGSSNASHAINFSAQPPSGASFTADKYNVQIGEQVSFQYNGSVDFPFAVDFGDLTTALNVSAGSSHDPIPHIYTNAGTYSVVFTYYNYNGECLGHKILVVTVDPPPSCPTGQITYVKDEVVCEKIHFHAPHIDQSIISWEWNFGDGCTLGPGSGTITAGCAEGTFQNPIHTYPGNGVYAVSVKITYNTGTEVICIYPIEVPIWCGCIDCIGSFAPLPGEKYIFGAWVHQSNSESAITYTEPFISLSFSGPNISLLPFRAKGLIIDGWQRIEEEFIVPVGSYDITVHLHNGGSNDVYFDDIRIHPFKANLKSFVYDPVSLRLMAELDENNYATFYEYDEEGALIRVKKETEKGIKTIKESGNNTRKK